MTKKILACAMILAAALSARAETLKGGFFTAEVPDKTKWRLEKIDGASACIASADQSAALFVARLPAGDSTLREAAEKLAKLHGASSVRRAEDGSAGLAWEYQGQAEGRPVYGQVFELPKKARGYIAVIGDRGNPEIVSIFNSIVIR